jgi:hypothetical protein
MMLLRTLLAQTRRDVYQGHHSDGSSIQRHSVGSTYPYIVVIQAGRVTVVDSLLNVRFEHLYDDSVKAERLDAYGRAYEAAEKLADAKRGVA